MRKGPLLEAILEQKEAVHKDGWNVVTSQRRDVSASSVFSSLKAKKGVEFEVSGIVRTRVVKSEQQ